MTDFTAIRDRFTALSDHLDKRGKRIFAATQARMAGYGGIIAVSRDRHCAEHYRSWLEGIGW